MSAFGGHSHRTQIPSLFFYPFRDLLPFFPEFPWHQFSNHGLLHPAKQFATAHESVYNGTSGCFSFHAKWTTWVSTPTGRFSFTALLRGCLRKGLQCCSCPLSDGVCMLCRIICIVIVIYKSNLSFLFLSQVIIRSYPWGHRCWLGER